MSISVICASYPLTTRASCCRQTPTAVHVRLIASTRSPHPVYNSTIRPSTRVSAAYHLRDRRLLPPPFPELETAAAVGRDTAHEGNIRSPYRREICDEHGGRKASHHRRSTFADLHPSDCRLSRSKVSRDGWSASPAWTSLMVPPCWTLSPITLWMQSPARTAQSPNGSRISNPVLLRRRRQHPQRQQMMAATKAKRATARTGATTRLRRHIRLRQKDSRRAEVQHCVARGKPLPERVRRRLTSCLVLRTTKPLRSRSWGKPKRH